MASSHSIRLRMRPNMKCSVLHPSRCRQLRSVGKVLSATDCASLIRGSSALTEWVDCRIRAHSMRQAIGRGSSCCHRAGGCGLGLDVLLRKAWRYWRASRLFKMSIPFACVCSTTVASLGSGSSRYFSSRKIRTRDRSSSGVTQLCLMVLNRWGPPRAGITTRSVQATCCGVGMASWSVAREVAEAMVSAEESLLVGPRSNPRSLKDSTAAVASLLVLLVVSVGDDAPLMLSGMSGGTAASVSSTNCEMTMLARSWLSHRNTTLRISR
mmetsp:Transcript_17766/g.50498  ORF Transcript_17766/g.50498 Transcript_17766/m.50498 type:complete len:268 (+) Transcript_17766:481-1284(+)